MALLAFKVWNVANQRKKGLKSDSKHEEFREFFLFCTNKRFLRFYSLIFNYFCELFAYFCIIFFYYIKCLKNSSVAVLFLWISYMIMLKSQKKKEFYDSVLQLQFILFLCNLSSWYFIRRWKIIVSAIKYLIYAQMDIVKK